jgi:hypothetical protein
MTGEMCKAEVTREAYPLHFKFADTHRGTAVAAVDSWLSQHGGMNDSDDVL